MSTMRRAFIALFAASIATGSAAQAQVSGSPQRATRSELSQRAIVLENQLSSGALKGDRKRAAQSEAAEIRTRLAEGDFHVGDRFVLTFTLDSVRSDTISVRDGVNITVSNLPSLSLAGVLRSELDTTLAAHVSRYFKFARVRTVTLTQVSMLGAVARPGFYWAAPDRPVSDLIMLAGGPAPEANLEELEVRRANDVVLKAKDSRRALRNGSTIEQVGIRSGDQVSIPLKHKFNWSQIIQLLFVASSLFFATLQFIQWYYNRKE